MAEAGDEATVSRLLSGGVAVDARDAEGHIRWKALTPAEWAARFGHTETAEFLRTRAAGPGGPAATS